MDKKVINTPNAPAAIGTYSQAVQAGDTLYVSGQIPLDPQTMTMVSDDFVEQATQAFANLAQVIAAAGKTTADVVKLTIYLTDLGEFANVNTVMSEFFAEPYPARAAVEVAALPKGAMIEMDAIVCG